MKKHATILVNLDERREMKRLKEATQTVADQQVATPSQKELRLATLEKFIGSLTTKHVFPTDILFKMRDEQRR